MDNHTPPKSLDVKLNRIVSDPSCKDFILADAKDADMAHGLAAAGQSPEHHTQEGRFRSLEAYRDLIRQNVRQGLVDIMLTSASTNEQLSIQEHLFDGSTVTPAVRANDTTDIHLVSGGIYATQPSRPFRTATIDHIMCGKCKCEQHERGFGTDLGLYSVTLNNNVERDLETLNAYRAFRIEAESKGFRHFLEIFNPNACAEDCPDDLGRFINDHVVRMLAGVTSKGRPLFLKIPYHGPAAMEQLASYDRTIVPGILGGASGTTFDAFNQLSEARKHGARAALYGRMINHSEHQPTFIQHLRWLADGDLDDPTEAVRSYHATLVKLSICPIRELEKDVMPTQRYSAYASQGVITSAAQSSRSATAVHDESRNADFSAMTATEKIAWNRKRWDRVLG